MKNSNLFKPIIRLLLSLRKRALTKEGSDKILQEFNQKVDRAGGIQTIVHKLKLMYEYFRHPQTSTTKKALVGAALLYFLLPTDVVVDWIPVMGYVDDVTAALFVWSLLSNELDEFEKLQKHRG
ncbi:YkvA family protein [Paenactinomyces guangxiensis]|uniref:DUF1232 domain-containing protein n=1 Tax=Paenactinomyces guangxiensis TaxID=1490290 RepID=A0A7W2A6V4_9BACL|nr:DUF1232 domain-containing protein [Paenactinomyces guangxiensis]MBA4492920.1 DUF1232 domain-containing protein [Paenactinomyces guangxiensis]MBH8590231.1 DUF1232 domain-containing protein [Paenactinomyces guangxiensis]